MKRIGIIGSTGSIGRSCLKVIDHNRELFQAVSLTGGENVALMTEQIRSERPAYVALATEQAAKKLRESLREAGVNSIPEIGFGTEGMKTAATLPEVDIVLSATVGVAGLEATYKAIQAGKTIALANKETMVAAGELVTTLAREKKVELLPVDSEHSGVHQCLRAGRRKEEVRRLVLTASGGPFLRTSKDELEHVTVEQALRHPTWNMGSRITIDSATLMNKGLEVIEAHWLFGFSPEQIEVKVHPQSTVHSLVEFIDGSIVAQLSVNDMQIPIQYALTYPERTASNGNRFDWSKLSVLEFSDPDTERFPSLKLAYQALEQGASYPCSLNAADEVAVAAFLERRISFGAIPRLVKDVLERMPARKFQSMEDVMEHDRSSRELARRLLTRHEN
ncbi:MAG: 1-deoxy-D-xylulose-5-phosphate reductoisomerase [Acidobacteria bacterium RIFCSPLOWO2_12_FULL_54_10]|nr:MAG: 1-deoxy-D-xylulose-5-phosphate reductoisomerase [Acidobacteria bacterium RIFCSPLOWO2_12_FULL_54_10]